MGARFSNQLLQTLVVLFRKRAPKNRRLLVIATTSERTVMKQMGVITDAEIAVPAVSTLDDLSAILKATEVFDDHIHQSVLKAIYERTGTEEVKVGIKNILNILDTSQAEEEKAASIFVDLLSEQIVENTYDPQRAERTDATVESTDVPQRAGRTDAIIERTDVPQRAGRTDAQVETKLPFRGWERD